MVTLSDEQILDLINDPKPLPDGLFPSPKMTMRNHSLRKDIEITSSTGNSFVIKLRQSDMNAFDFSVILGYRVPGLNKVFLLRRYNGRSHPHTNPIEDQKFRDFHRHTATERYQKRGAKEEHFAEVDKRFSDMQGAIECLLRDCGFASPIDNAPLFTGQML
jgi:hypothetical protein